MNTSTVDGSSFIYLQLKFLDKRNLFQLLQRQLGEYCSQFVSESDWETHVYLGAYYDISIYSLYFYSLYSLYFSNLGFFFNAFLKGII